MSKTKRKPWKKNLYENQGYEDNYTDPSFLKELATNKDLKIFDYREAVRGASRLVFQGSIVTFFLIIFYYLYDERISPSAVFLYSSIATIFGFFCYIGKEINVSTCVENSRTGVCVLVFGYIFSPLLHTLTDSISTDTIFSTTGFVMFLHLVFYDYGISSFIVSKAISLNAAIFGAICLASRLSSSFHAFVLLTMSSEFFALGPILVDRIWTPYLVLPASAVCSYFLYQISTPVLVTYLWFLFFLNIVCPYIFWRQQENKKTIFGPWDEAIVDEIDVNKDDKKKQR
ncbi:phosphatidylinositol N-acetylglucosaminyltransferase subunit C [Culicoides brevitarsis]|uniref:phosphatidylinositol N-acetylglucosaminyltransferase subunit C n=1 Tax=Culicoides brevitarsis TaxID=469753 RepID=UPI00307C113D